MENQNLNLPFNFQYNQSCIPPSGLSQPYQMQPFQGTNTQIQSTFMSQPQQNTQGYNQNFQNQQNFNSFGSNFSNNIISNPIPNYSFYVPNQYSTQPSQNLNNSMYPAYTTPQQIQQQQYPIAQPQIQQNQSYLPDTSNFNQGFLQNGQKLQGNAQIQQQNSNQFSTFALTQSFNPQNQNNDNFNITNQIISQNEKLLKAKQSNDVPKNVINLEDDDEEPVTKINNDDSSSVQIINPSELQQQSMKTFKPQKDQNLSQNLQPTSNQSDLMNNFQSINFLQNSSKQFDQKQLNNFIVNNNSNTNQSNFNQISNNNTNINTNTNLQNNHSEQQLNNINLNNQINGSYKNEIQQNQIQNQNQNFKNTIQSQQLSNIAFNQKNNEKLMTNLEKKTSAINDPSLNQINVSPFLTSKQSQNHKQQQRHHFNLCIDDDDDSVIFEDKWALEKENNVKNNNNFSSTNYTSNINNNHNLPNNNNNGYLGQEKQNINNSINNVSLSKIIMNDQQNSSQLEGQKQILQKQQSFKQKQKLQALEQKRQQKEIQRELKLEKEKEEKKRKVDDRIKQKKQKEEEIYKKKQEEKLIIQQMIHEQQQNQKNDQDYVQKFENYYHIDKYERIWLLCQDCKGRILKSNINDINQTEFDRYQEPRLCPKCAQIKQKQKKLERQEQKLQQKKKKEEEKKIQSTDKQNQQLTEEDDEFKAQIMHGPEFQTQLPPYYTNNEEQIKKFKEFHKKRLLSNLLYKGNTQKQEYLKCHGLVKSVVKGNHFSHYDFNNLIQKHNFQFEEINKKLKSEDKSFISTIYQYQGSNSRQTRHKNKRYQYGQEYSNYM
ncbi:hypothetical protein PPERSA_08389 [Pseudocohnilembus persalinus]|uniref:Uncharacterized protein n=1 Tax=Pseudocohnilembus persalinus TaxID=266149 RepID=A0A0V0R652_PSEPJ|nr:hypothetical protein PPERSA_08389 [Pseudocohnilembus persalinus]|eukprot:KRX09988.1 hypothetical protein PPERSA_08389 [Pseudocohnilembus persalinus]